MATEQKPASAESNRSGHTSQLGWFGFMSALVFIFFCFEIGVFLIVFPWLPARAASNVSRTLWENNYFSWFGQGWHDVWTNPYFKGAVSGLGVVNVAISFSELFRLRRFSNRARALRRTDTSE